MERLTLEEILKFAHLRTHTNEEYTIVLLLQRMIKLFPEATKEVQEIIDNNSIADIAKAIRQQSDEAPSMLFYDILNCDFGYKLLKMMKEGK